MFLNVLAAVVAVWALARYSSWAGSTLALLAALVAGLSFANGLVLLGLVPLGLFLGPGSKPWPTRMPRTAVAIVVGTVLIAVYLGGLDYGEHPRFWLEHPRAYFLYVLAYVGASVASWSTRVAVVAGGFGILAIAAVSIALLRRPSWRPRAFPWLLLAAYVVGSGVVTGIGRVYLGTSHALVSHYVTISSLFWLSLLVLVALDLARLRQSSASRRLMRVRAVIVTGAVLAVVLGIANSSRYAMAGLAGRHQALVEGEACVRLYRNADDACLAKVYPFIPLLRTFAASLEASKLGPFAEGHRSRAVSGGPSTVLR